jgi:hypothetical protein
MATYIPSETIVIPRQKLLPPRVDIVGQSRLDKGQGVVNMEAVGLLVDDAGEPILDSEGKEQFKGTGRVFSVAIPDILQKQLAGIAGAQVLEFIAALFDELAQESEAQG